MVLFIRRDKRWKIILVESVNGGTYTSSRSIKFHIMHLPNNQQRAEKGSSDR